MSLLDRGTSPDPFDTLPPAPLFTLTSDDFADGDTLPPTAVHTSAGGQNLSPHLAWTGFPPGTQSFVVTCFDPDAPTGSGFWHWTLVDVPASVTELPHGVASGDLSGLPVGSFHVRNDYGTVDFGGVAPPEGDRPHRYVFAVHAVDVPSLGIPDSVSPAVVGFNLTFHTLARGVLRATYQR
ncbi:MULTISPECIES: YbhB/YbcL family Raf kinase inhibitor-like protein [unclassified Frankia]|uniref:YbhB/YbcL family Raf kinase inhibitor-like protein n=1 Tax=unclassified Frankia TaxID=2632575 RepID=UPI002AD518D8|nr:MULTISPECIES: YbhB/YbcL family Raf kinase inhibitor-like protein [unclassified Frankia]